MYNGKYTYNGYFVLDSHIFMSYMYLLFTVVICLLLFVVTEYLYIYFSEDGYIEFYVRYL